LRHAGFTAEGLRPNDSLLRKYHEAVRQFRYERVGRNEANRITIATDETVLVPGDWGSFLAVLLARSNHCIFGSPGAEVWYGGRTEQTHAAQDRVWAEIEAHSSHREVDYQRWPLPMEKPAESVELSLPADNRRKLIRLGRLPPFKVQYFGDDRRYHEANEGTTVTAIQGGREGRDVLFVSVDDFDEDTRQGLEEPQYQVDADGKFIWKNPKTDETVASDERPPDGAWDYVRAKKRRRRVNWEAVPELLAKAKDIRDRTKWLDLRDDVTFDRVADVELKAPVVVTPTRSVFG
jgi:hypothetical protein